LNLLLKLRNPERKATSEKWVPFDTGKEVKEAKPSSSRIAAGNDANDGTAQVAGHPSDDADECTHCRLWRKTLTLHADLGLIN
jgi:hypothetical protein